MPHNIDNEILIPLIAELLVEGKKVVFTPSGVSMRPFIEGGCDSVMLYRLPKVQVGDICLVRLNENNHPRYVLHRVIRIEGDQITLMGDGNLQGEEHTLRQDIFGTVVSILSPNERRKPLTHGRCWYALRRWRWLGLKVYRHTVVKYLYKHTPQQIINPHNNNLINKQTMKAIRGFRLRPLGDEYILVGESIELVNFNKMITLNDTAAYLWKQVTEVSDYGDFDAEQLADSLTKEYEVSHEQALHDAQNTIDTWLKIGVIE